MRAEHFKINRRTVLRGVGVTMALPWLESMPVWGAQAAADGAASSLSQTVRRALHGQRHQPQALVGQGRRQGHGALQVARADACRFAPSSM